MSAVNRRRPRLAMAAAAVGLLVSTLGMSAGTSGAAGLQILPTKTVVAFDATAGDNGGFVATVTIAGLNLGPITPKGTVEFDWNNPEFGVVHGSFPLSSCVILLSKCTAVMPFPNLPNSNVTATYTGDALSKPSTGFVHIS